MKLSDLKVGETYFATLNSSPERSDAFSYTTYEGRVTVRRLGVKFGPHPQRFYTAKDWGWVKDKGNSERTIEDGKYVLVDVETRSDPRPYIIPTKSIKCLWSEHVATEQAKEERARRYQEVSEQVEAEMRDERQSEIASVIRTTAVSLGYPLSVLEAEAIARHLRNGEYLNMDTDMSVYWDRVHALLGDTEDVEYDEEDES